MLQRTDDTDCDWPTEEFVSPEILDERKRIITGMFNLLVVVGQSAPHPIKVLAQQVLADALGLCPVHATRDDLAEALDNLGFPVPELPDAPGPEYLGGN